MKNSPTVAALQNTKRLVLNNWVDHNNLSHSLHVVDFYLTDDFSSIFGPPIPVDNVDRFVSLPWLQEATKSVINSSVPPPAPPLFNFYDMVESTDFNTRLIEK